MRLRALPIVMSMAVLAGCSKNPSAGAGGASAAPHPLPPPDHAAPGDGSSPLVIAISKLFVGKTDRQGRFTATAWEDYGFDLDHQVTAIPFLGPTSFAKHCLPRANGSAEQNFPDGPGGRDNSFGRNVLPVITNLAGQPAFDDGIREMTESGKLTLLIDMPGLGQATNENPVRSFAMLGENFDGSAWRLVPNSIAGETPDSATCQLPASYLTNDTWVSGGETTLILPIQVCGIDVRLTIHHVVIQMLLSQDRHTATNGTIAGILNVNEFLQEIRRLFGACSPSFCTGEAPDALAQQLAQAADILSDGTQDPTKTCDGISIGLGFEGKAATIGGVGPTRLYPDPCAPGG